jgi:CysZ protein
MWMTMLAQADDVLTSTTTEAVAEAVPAASQIEGFFVTLVEGGTELFSIVVLGLVFAVAIGAGAVWLKLQMRHLFWLLPALNVGLYLAIGGPISLEAQTSRWAWPAVVFTLLCVALNAFVGLAGAAIVSPGAMLLKCSQDDSYGDEVKQRDTAALGRQVARTPWGAYWQGITTPIEGWRFLMRHATLWRYAAIPVTLNLLISLVLMVGLFMGASWMVTGIAQWLGEGFWGVTLGIIAGVLFLCVALAISIVVAFLLQSVFCDYFYSILAEKTEHVIGIEEGEIESITLKYEIIDAVKDFGRLAVIEITCLAVQFIPVVGTATGIAAGYYFTCLLFGRDYLDHPMALRGMRLDEKVAMLKRHRLHALGLGTVGLGLAFLPGIGSLLLPSVIVGGVLLHRRLRAHDEAKGISFTTRAADSVPTVPSAPSP